jgi:hypothetical protein
MLSTSVSSHLERHGPNQGWCAGSEDAGVALDAGTGSTLRESDGRSGGLVISSSPMSKVGVPLGVKLRQLIQPFENQWHAPII